VRVKVDENVPVVVVQDLRDRGIDAHTVSEEDLTGTPDSDLVEIATKENRMVFTLDRGFGDIRLHPPGSHAGIVVFRLDDESAPSAQEAVAALVDHHDLDDLRGSITVVHKGTLRIRRPAS
jgi:predicted nuclease of predicted toxin-antitoxin system